MTGLCHKMTDNCWTWKKNLDMGVEKAMLCSGQSHGRAGKKERELAATDKQACRGKKILSAAQGEGHHQRYCWLALSVLS